MVLNCASLRHVIPITSSLQAERHKIPNRAGLWLVCNTSLSILSASKLILHYRPRVPPQRKQASACSFSKLKHTRYLPELDFFFFFFFSLWAERCGSERDSLNVRKPINNAHTACYSSNSLCSDGSQNLVCLCVCAHMPALEVMSDRRKGVESIDFKTFPNGKGSDCLFSVRKPCRRRADSFSWSTVRRGNTLELNNKRMGDWGQGHKHMCEWDVNL